jgi:hypothetical protein
MRAAFSEMFAKRRDHTDSRQELNLRPEIDENQQLQALLQLDLEPRSAYRPARHFSESDTAWPP